MEGFSWEPWETFKSREGELILPVDAPPCPHCKYWRPRVKTTPDGEYDGVVMCYARDMYGDFSCFKQVVLPVKGE